MDDCTPLGIQSGTEISGKGIKGQPPSRVYPSLFSSLPLKPSTASQALSAMFKLKLSRCQDLRSLRNQDPHFSRLAFTPFVSRPSTPTFHYSLFSIPPYRSDSPFSQAARFQHAVASSHALNPAISQSATRHFEHLAMGHSLSSTLPTLRRCLVFKPNQDLRRTLLNTPQDPLRFEATHLWLLMSPSRPSPCARLLPGPLRSSSAHLHGSSIVPALSLPLNRCWCSSRRLKARSRPQWETAQGLKISRPQVQPQDFKTTRLKFKTRFKTP
ncbi:hypothetical protein DFH08DRAFT_965184 [Mycena albidolilacea]|uniref:Uncharacterized protein n=1 Tax=Mycena albidolilacea TaxID=1033008 RepID=A0AAD6ZS02_9AGAR|nr:hypothetical protein DFH08DRAFT_965184 [Mycena albidolilacea]